MTDHTLHDGALRPDHIAEGCGEDHDGRSEKQNSQIALRIRPHLRIDAEKAQNAPPERQYEQAEKRPQHEGAPAAEARI